MRARRLLGTCDRHEAESASGGRSHSHHQHTSPGDTGATLDERQGHVSALLHLSASVFDAIGHLRRGGKQGLVRHSQPLRRPVHESHHSQYIDRKTRRSPCRWSHTGRCDCQPQTVRARFYTRVSLRQVFHLHFPPMRAWLEQPHGRHHKAPPCILTTTP